MFIGGLHATNTLSTGKLPINEQSLYPILIFSLRSHTDKTILLVKLGDRYVPIAESAVVLLPEEREETSEKEAGSDSECREREERLLAKSVSERLASESERLSKREGSRSLLSADSSRSLAGIPSISEKDEHAEEEDLALSLFSSPLLTGFGLTASSFPPFRPPLRPAVFSPC